MAQLPIPVETERIREFCHKHSIRKLSFFGSILTSRFQPQSDVDVLVEFAPGRTPGFIRLAGMERELSAILGRKADIRTAEDLSRHFREDIVASAAVQYESV
ncbi:MAG: nucleotidyltransferase domain-containing protein [Acidobacteria bacterium]|nr:nucleotidyltransferase domain-containing protein [Acidobacteriota bacterium]